jgi:diguanylate cyclase (GGDEF)-like protein/PAS domain S-box-containing protein
MQVRSSHTDGHEPEPLAMSDEQQARMVFEGAPIGMALVGIDGRFLRVNPALCELVGYDADTLMRSTFQDITHPDDLELDLELLHACLDGRRDGYQMEKRYLHRAGHEVWVSLHVAVARDAEGRPTGFVSQILDISDRRAAEASQARFTALVEHGSDLIAIADAEGHLVYASPAYGTMLGWDVDEWLGRSLQDQVHPDDWQIVEDGGAEILAEPGASVTLEFRYAHADGSWRWVDATLTNRLEDPAVRGFVINTRDITDRVLAAEHLAHRATHDALTGLPDRSVLTERLVQAEAAAARRGMVVATLFVDVDHFKHVNDTHGHAIGDMLLTAVARRLRATARAEDMVFRLGGDEFVLVATVADDAAAAELSARVCAAFRAPFVLDDRVLTAGASVGVATTTDGASGSGLLDAADVALYEAKAAGRARWVAYRSDLRRPQRPVAAAPAPPLLVAGPTRL